MDFYITIFILPNIFNKAILISTRLMQKKLTILSNELNDASNKLQSLKLLTKTSQGQMT